MTQAWSCSADSTITGWVDEAGAVANVDDASSLVFDRCAIHGNGVPSGALVLTTRLAARTPCTVAVRDCSISRNHGPFYGLFVSQYGVLFSDAPLEVATRVFGQGGVGLTLSPSRPLADLDAARSAPVLRQEDSPLLRVEDEPVRHACAACMRSIMLPPSWNVHLSNDSCWLFSVDVNVLVGGARRGVGPLY